MVLYNNLQQQQAYKQFDKGEITFTQFKDILKEMKVDVPQTKFGSFKELIKIINQPKRTIPQITINLQDQSKMSLDNIFSKAESPTAFKVGRRIVTLQDSPLHKNESSYVFTSANKQKEQQQIEKDSRLVGSNYLQRKRSIKPIVQSNGNIILGDVENVNPISARGPQTYKKNSSSMKTGEGLFSDKQVDKKFLFNVQNKEHTGNGDIIKNQFVNPQKQKKRTLLESQHKWNN